MQPTEPVSKPNFVVIVTDDLGYGDLSCMGSEFATPALDRLAGSGVRLTDWYSNAPVCSPSRASLLTGRYPADAGVRQILGGRRTTPGLPAGTPTIAEVLQPLGYRSAAIGKWHLGAAEGSRPREHGFDEFFGFHAGAVDYFSQIYYWGQGNGINPIHDLWENEEEVWANGQYLTDLFTERAVQFIRERPEPFFLYLAYNAPHFPMHAPGEYLDRFRDLSPDRRIMAAMISAVDDGVGMIINELARRGLTERTLVIFTSDNGPARSSRNWLDGREDLYYGGTAGRLKGHKFSLFDGGIRVPGLISWPGRIPAGQVVGAPLAAMDVYPTLLKAAGGEEDPRCDGRDMLATLTNGEGSPHDSIFWELDEQTAVRRDNWKLVLHGRLVDAPVASEEVFLSDLETDIAEQENLAGRHRDIATSLREEAETWRSQLEARWERRL